MKTRLLKFALISGALFIFATTMPLNSQTVIESEGGAYDTSVCGHGYMRMCGYFVGTGLPAYDGPWYA